MLANFRGRAEEHVAADAVDRDALAFLRQELPLGEGPLPATLGLELLHRAVALRLGVLPDLGCKKRLGLNSNFELI